MMIIIITTGITIKLGGVSTIPDNLDKVGLSTFLKNKI